jgi:hypothetical protein
LFSNAGTGAVTIAPQGSDNLYIAGRAGSANAALGNGDWAWFVCDGSSSWTVTLGSLQLGYSAAFGASLATNGYQKLPSGMIIQWGFASSSGATANNLVITLPIAFPGSILNAQGIAVGSSAASLLCQLSLMANTTVTFTTVNNGAFVSAQGVRWVAIGF